MVENIQVKRPNDLYFVRLKIGRFYRPGTNVEGILMSICRRKEGSPIYSEWVSEHLEFIRGFLETKYLSSEAMGRNCGLIRGARDHYGDEETLRKIAKIVIDPPYHDRFPLSLAELSLIVKEGDVKKIFIPNISISRTKKEGRPVPHDDEKTLINSDSCNIIRMICQYAAANPYPNLTHEEKSERFNKWLAIHGDEAIERFREEFKFGDESKRYIEAKSPDEILRGLTLSHDEPFVPYEERNLNEVDLGALEAHIVGTA